MLNPDDEQFPKTIQLPPLPSYGPDPYLGKAPVVLPDSAYQASVPLVTQVPAPAAPAQTQTQPPAIVPDTTTQSTTKHHHKSAGSSLPAPSTYQGQSNPPSSGYAPSSPLQTAPPSAQPALIPAPIQPSSTAPAPPSQQLYLPGQSAPPNQQPATPLIPQNPQAQGPTPRDYDLQTGLKLSNPEQQAAERLKMPQTTSVSQMDALIESPIRPIENVPLTLPSTPLPHLPLSNPSRKMP